MESIKSFGDYVKHSRFRLGLSISESAGKVGISETQMCRIENNKCTPSAKTFSLLVKGLEMNVDIAYSLLEEK